MRTAPAIPAIAPGTANAPGENLRCCIAKAFDGFARTPAKVGRVTRTSEPRRLGIYQQPKQFWLFSLLQSLVVVATSYLIGVFTYLVIVALSAMPNGPLWDDGFRAPLAFLLVVIAAAALMIPYFHKEWDRGARSLSIFSALFLLAFASLSSTHIADPKIPLNLISAYAIEPLRHFLKF